MRIIYGSEPPKISFTNSPKGDIAFKIENRNYVETEDKNKNITWADLYRADHKVQSYMPLPLHLQDDEVAKKFIEEKFRSFEMTECERIFLKFYVELCISELTLDNLLGSTYKHLILYPALIPQVWVNWIHYDSKDSTRAERAQRQPFRVDFLLKADFMEKSPLIIEIDGASHFGAFATDPQQAMIVYTEHLRKDRWLRKQGWNVIRISNYEIVSCQTLSDFQDLFLEISDYYLGYIHS